MSGDYFFVTRGRFSQRGGGLQTPPCAPRADSAATGKLPTYCPATAPPHYRRSTPNPVGGLRGQLPKCASCPHPLQGLHSHPTCQSGHMAAPHPEEPGRAAASQHTQGSHMLARPPGMQARVLPWHGAHSRAQPGQCTAWQMAAGWGPGGE